MGMTDYPYINYPCAPVKISSGTPAATAVGGRANAPARRRPASQGGFRYAPETGPMLESFSITCFSTWLTAEKRFKNPKQSVN